MIVAAYLKARETFDNVQAEVDELAKVLSELGSAMASRPGQINFTNARTQLPVESVIALRSKSFSTDDLKTGEQINQILLRWHSAKNALEDLWLDVPPSLRPSLIHPDQRTPPPRRAQQHRNWGTR
jgi:hypothetical protein